MPPDFSFATAEFTTSSVRSEIRQLFVHVLTRQGTGKKMEELMKMKEMDKQSEELSTQEKEL